MHMLVCRCLEFIWFCLCVIYKMGFPGSSTGEKKIHLKFRRPRFDSWMGKIPWSRERLPTPVSWLENSMDCIVQGVAKSRRRLNKLSLSLSIYNVENIPEAKIKNRHDIISFIFSLEFYIKASMKVNERQYRKCGEG